MKTVKLEEDLQLFYVEATSFPNGIKDAFSKLENMLPSRKGRKFFGIYEKNDKTIIYKAAVLEQFEGEATRYNCEYFTIEKGHYLTETIENWQDKIASIGQTFEKLAMTGIVNPQNPAIEYYKTQKELVCMLKMND